MEDRVAKLEAAIRAAYAHLMNLQPHIAQLLPAEQPFIDAHVDAAMTELADALPDDLKDT